VERKINGPNALGIDWKKAKLIVRDSSATLRQKEATNVSIKSCQSTSSRQVSSVFRQKRLKVNASGD